MHISAHNNQNLEFKLTSHLSDDELCALAPFLAAEVGCAVDEEALDHVPRLLVDVVLVPAQELVREGHAQLVRARGGMQFNAYTLRIFGA